jgi:hypothetical protein
MKLKHVQTRFESFTKFVDKFGFVREVSNLKEVKV